MKDDRARADGPAPGAGKGVAVTDDLGIRPVPTGPPSRGVVVVAESNARPYGQRITVGGHELLADEPVEIGGAATGPGPYDLLLAALGACTAITVRMYAERKSWPLRHITVRLRHRRVHAKDCADCETKIGWMDRIERELQFDGELTDEQRTALLDIAERCPVYRTLHSAVTISTTDAVSRGTGPLTGTPLSRIGLARWPDADLQDRDFAGAGRASGPDA